MRSQAALLDETRLAHAPALGRDFTGYRNHACRVLHFAAAFAGPRRRLLSHPWSPLPMFRL